MGSVLDMLLWLNRVWLMSGDGAPGAGYHTSRGREEG